MFDTTKYPFIPAREWQLFFINFYDDGPIEGLTIYQGQVARFVAQEETLFNEHWIYRIEQLSADELAYELEQKAEFEDHVGGTHWSFDSITGKPLQRKPIDAARSNTYYARQKNMGVKKFPPAVILGWSLSAGY